jgi:hypothetical protein
MRRTRVLRPRRVRQSLLLLRLFAIRVPTARMLVRWRMSIWTGAGLGFGYIEHDCLLPRLVV